MNCKLCGGFVSPKYNKGDDTTPICVACDNEKAVRQNENIKVNPNANTQHQQSANIAGNQNVIHQNYVNSTAKKCSFCSEEAVTHCVDCQKPLCESHTYTLVNKDRCNGCNTFRMGEAGVKGVINTVKGFNGMMRWLDSLWFR